MESDSSRTEDEDVRDDDSPDNEPEYVGLDGDARAVGKEISEDARASDGVCATQGASSRIRQGQEVQVDQSAIEQIAAAVLRRGESWSGALPAPSDFYQYTAEDRERMMSWNDSFSSDESRRQDRLVEATISQTRTNSRFLRWLVGCSTVASCGAYLIFRDLAISALLIGAPLAQQVVAMIPDISRTLRRGGEGRSH